MTTYNLSGYFGAAGGGKDGASVDIWATSRFAGMPAQNQAPPGGSPDAGPVTTGVNFGGPGAYYISGIPGLQDYYVRVVYDGNAYWSQRTAASLGGVVAGGGGNSVQAFPFQYAAGTQFGFLPVSPTGTPFYLPIVQQFISDWWVVIDANWDGLTPKFDMGFLTSGEVGVLGAVGAAPIDMWTPEESLTGLTGGSTFTTQAQSASWSSALTTLGLTGGPPVPRQQLFIDNPSESFVSMIVSQDGTAATAVPASLTGAVAPTLPNTFLSGPGGNNQFEYAAASPTTGGGGVAFETFSIANGTVCNNLHDLEVAMAAATGSVSGTFAKFCTITDDGTHLILTANGSQVLPGGASNGNALAAGNHDATTPLGFTAANVFAGGAGGDPGATQGTATLCLQISTIA